MAGYNELQRLGLENYELREEIKNLKEENEWFNKKIKQAGKYVATTMKENRKLEKENRKLKEDIDNGFNRETDLRNRRADSLLENKDLRDKIEELEKEIEKLNKMMLFETKI